MIETKEYRPTAQINPAPKSPYVETVEYNPARQTLSSPSSASVDDKADANRFNATGVNKAGINKTGVNAASINKTGVNTAGNKAAEVNTAQTQIPRRNGLPSYALRLERLRKLADEAAREIPEELLMHLHGGISMSDKSKLHKSSDPNKPLYILGEYCNSSSIGRHIILYGGSIDRVYGTLSDDALKKELDRIIKHELTHHWESLSGTRDLEIYDADKIRKYKNGLNKNTETK